MKILKKWMVFLLAAVMTAAVAFAMTACDNGEETPGPDTGDGNKLASPVGFTFDSTTGDYSFTAVENGQFYYVVVET